MKAAVQHYVPYTGNIETNISSVRASMLAVKETDEVSGHFLTQLQKITDAGISFDKAMPAVAGGIMLSCENPQQVYDAVFGSSQPQRSAIVIDFAQAKEQRAERILTTAFMQSADKFPIMRDFKYAARASMTAANMDRAPIPAAA